MKTDDFAQACRDYDRIEKAITYIEKNFDRQPDLKEISEHVGLSEFHFQRLFSSWVGISPKRFLQFLTKEYVKELLSKPTSLLDATFDAGLSGPGRLHDLFVACEAVTPGEFKARGKGLTITYGFHDSPFGECLIARTDRGICWLSFVRNGGRKALLDELGGPWENARIVEDPAKTRPLVARIYDPAQWRRSSPLPILVKGTNFQIKGLGGAAAHPGRNRGELRGHRALHRLPQSRARRGQRRRQEPGLLCHPMPPGRAQDGRIRQLRRRPGAKKGNDRLGSQLDGIIGKPISASGIASHWKKHCERRSKMVDLHGKSWQAVDR